MLDARERQRAVWLGAVSRALAATVAVTLLAFLLGAVAGADLFRRLAPASEPLTPVQAAALAAGVAALEAWRRRDGRWTWGQAALAGAALAAALATAAHFSGMTWAGPADLDSFLGLLLLGCGLAALGAPTQARRLGEAALLAACTLGGATLLAHAYGTPALVPGLDPRPMALPLAYALVALPVAALLAQAEQGLLRILLLEGLGGRLARALLPPAIAFPLLLGWAVLRGQRAGVLEAPTGVAVGALAASLLACALVAWGAAATRRDERALREAEDHWRLLTDSVSEPIATVDAAGRIQEANRALQLLFERNGEELRGLAVASLVAPAHHAALAGLLEAGTGRTAQVEGLRRDGRPFPAEVSVAAWKGGTLRTLVLRDASRRQMVEQALRAARQAAEEAARAKADFLANMSHEIRTPMNAVIGMTQLLGQTPLTPEQADCVRTLRSSGEHLMTVINDILDYSKIEADKVELEQVPLDLRRCVEECLAIVGPRAKEKGLEARATFAPGVPDGIVGAPARLRQVLLNLLSNAVKFTDRGTVAVHADAKPLGGGRHELHLAVADTGMGIPPERFDRLFRSFSQVDSSTTRTHGGTGLGLAISKRLVDLMGGRIWAESTPGKGSTFHFTLSAAEAKPPAPAAPAVPSPRPAPRGLAVLLAEDNPVNQKVALRMLERLGLAADVAGNGEEAVEAVQRRAYDVVLMDVQMPRLDGFGATRRIRALPLPRQPYIVAMTADAMPGDRERCLEAGMDDYLSKPVRMEALGEALARAVPA
ncbi:MAG TPA: ATP-binding protein [Candidatus Thermoplasmatota archaeon]|nr:ATP-binding protein [Candidatus Thermoplasmatota archaeon]